MKKLQLNNRRLLPLVITIVGVAVLGAFVILQSHAATPTSSIEPENGTVAAPASQVSTVSASGGKSVKFGAVTSGGGTGVRTCPVYPAFPDASCSGVPSGSALTTISGDLATSSSGQIIDHKLITGDVAVLHSNVTITNSRILGRIANKASSGLTITDTDIGPDNCPTVSSFYNNLNGTGYTLLRSHVHNSGADIIGIGGTGTILIKDSIVNQACIYPGDHLDAAQFYAPGDVGNITIDHSFLDARPVNSPGSLGNAAIFWADSPGSGSRLTATHSKFAGGNFTLSLYDAKIGSGVIFDVNNNTIVKNSYNYGPCSSSNTTTFNGVEGLKFTGNVYEDGSAVPSC